MNNFEAIRTLIENNLAKGLPFRIKQLKNDNLSDWSSFIIAPVNGYLEIDTGPIRFKDIEFIDVNPVKLQHIGKLVPELTIDKTKELIDFMDNSCINYLLVDSFLRLPVNK